MTADVLEGSATLTLRLTGTYLLSVEGVLGNTQPVTFGFTVASQGTATLPVLSGTPISPGTVVRNTVATGSTSTRGRAPGRCSGG